MKPDLMQNRKIIQGWEFFETTIYGNGKWNFYKFKVNKKRDPFERLEQYFTKKDVAANKKDLEELFEIFEEHTWIPEDRLYIKTEYGIYDNLTNTKKSRTYDVSNNETRKIFLEKNKILPIEFIEWVLWVADWESIKTVSDILNNFFTLFEKFKIFSRNDLLPFELKTIFNTEIVKIQGNTVKLIEEINFHSFYKFVILCKDNQKMSLYKLLELVKNSEFLQGQGSFQNWAPSFDSYVNKLEDIFNFKYNKKMNVNKFRKLYENEYIIEDNIYTDAVIPNSVKEDYRLKKSYWPTENLKEIPWTADDDELESKYFIKKKSVLNKIENFKKKV